MFSLSPLHSAGTAIVVLALAFVCCSDDTSSVDAGVVDKGQGESVRPPDLGIKDGGGAGNIGSSCDPLKPTECVGKTSCLKLAEGLGVCTISSCTMEDISTPAIEDTCPKVTPPKGGAAVRTICTRVPTAGGQYCLPQCSPSTSSNPSSKFHSGLSCDPISILYNDHSEVCLLPGCTQDTDCWKAMKDSYCHKTTGTCFTNGKSGVKVGDPCKSSSDCGPNQYCYPQRKDSQGKVMVEGGYCTMVGCKYLKPWDCPAGSQCFSMGSLNALSLCLALGCSADKPPATDGCRDETSAGQYDCIHLDKYQVCWLAPN